MNPQPLKQVVVTMTPEMHAAIVREAELRFMKPSRFIRRLCKIWIAYQREQEDTPRSE